MTSKSLIRAIAAVGALTVLAVPMVPAAADEAEPPVSNTAWYWESQQSQKVTDPTSGADVATIEAPNPFCPSTSAGGPPEESGACKEARLPVEVVNSDYETPDKISAVAFDLSLVPIGSSVSKMTVRFLEAKDEQSRPINAEGKKLQACFVQQFFGGGDARQYKEAPRFVCTDGDPIAERKEVQVKNEEGEKEAWFSYTFDLTPFAIKWVEEGKLQSSIMLFPVKPKEAEFDRSRDSNWRVVLAGPAENNGVVTKLTYKPAALPGFDTPIDDGGGSTGFDSGGTFGSTGGSDFSSGSGSVGSTGGDTGGAAEDPVAEEGAPEALEDLAAEATSDEAPAGIPAYVWLALLAGMLGFSLLRQVVLEQAAGIRPDGVLAQIRKINEERRGVSLEEAGTSAPGRLDDVIKGLAGLGDRTTRFLSKFKIPFRKG